VQNWSPVASSVAQKALGPQSASAVHWRQTWFVAAMIVAGWFGSGARSLLGE